MIHRNNYQLAKGFLAYLRDVTQVNPISIERYWAYLKHLLLWADDVPLSQVVAKRPTFATYLTTPNEEGERSTLAALTLKKIFDTSKRFFTWAKSTYPREFHSVPLEWIEALRLPRLIEPPREHCFVQLEDVCQIARLQIEPADLALRRDQAAAAMLFLSGMRASAFASLTLECVDIPNRTIKQWPSLGVKTKNSKTATTYLLDIRDLIAVVEKWDSFIRHQLPVTATWYTPIVSQWGEQTLSPNPPGANRNTALGKRLRKLLARVGLLYQSPHKFRNGHAVFALQNATTMADYKAASMNLMHNDISVTDGIYAPLVHDEVKARIAGLTGSIKIQKAGDASIRDDTVRLSDDDLLAVLAHRLKSPTHSPSER
ncbi:MAG: site-specific integrase [Chloroflexi bacterium]|nr:site-specific integrase [Chloroflexota bacterium]